MFRKILTLAVSAGAAVGLALSAGAAYAAPMVHPDAVHAQSNGTAGIESLHGNQVQNIAGTLVAQPAFQNIGGLGQGGAGVQLCDPDNGFGLQIGLVSNGASDTVEYALGTLTGAASRKCEGNGVLPIADAHTLAPLLTGISIGDTVDVYASFANRRVFWHNSHGKLRSGERGFARFEAADINNGDLYTSPSMKTAADWGLNSAGAGLEQDTQLISACNSAITAPTNSLYPGVSGTIESASGTTPHAYPGPYTSVACNPAIAFTNVRTNTRGMLEYWSGVGLTVTGLWNDVYTSAGGLSSNPALVATNNTLSPPSGTGSSSFTVYVGNPVG